MMRRLCSFRTNAITIIAKSKAIETTVPRVIGVDSEIVHPREASAGMITIHNPYRTAQGRERGNVDVWVGWMAFCPAAEPISARGLVLGRQGAGERDLLSARWSFMAIIGCSCLWPVVWSELEVYLLVRPISHYCWAMATRRTRKIPKIGGRKA
jgi:hypothetical protein